MTSESRPSVTGRAPALMSQVLTGEVDADGDIDCTHKWSLRISSHADLVAAARSREPMFSMYSCRGKCRAKAHAYIRSLGYEPIEVAL